jgi:hypothetical protein
MMTEEDEAFNEIERQAKQRKESVRAAVQTLSEYERGFIDGMQKQMQSSVDKAVNAMSQRTWVGLTDEDRYEFAAAQYSWEELLIAAETKLKEKNT